jgi:hypothetical protein
MWTSSIDWARANVLRRRGAAQRHTTSRVACFELAFTWGTEESSTNAESIVQSGRQVNRIVNEF